MFYVLTALAEGELHGYAIIKEVAELTEGEVEMLPGTLYRIIKQLLQDGWISEVPATSDDDPRRSAYYKLTARGRRAAEAEARRLEGLVRLARMRRFLPARG
jgi:DNA-binding PadR family transcriptional regulator